MICVKIQNVGKKGVGDEPCVRKFKTWKETKRQREKDQTFQLVMSGFVCFFIIIVTAFCVSVVDFVFPLLITCDWQQKAPQTLNLSALSLLLCPSSLSLH